MIRRNAYEIRKERIALEKKLEAKRAKIADINTKLITCTDNSRFFSLCSERNSIQCDVGLIKRKLYNIKKGIPANGYPD
jgi:hypothetical protein